MELFIFWSWHIGIFLNNFLDDIATVLNIMASEYYLILGWQTKVGWSKRNDATAKQNCYRIITPITTDVLGSQTFIQNWPIGLLHVGKDNEFA